MNKMRTAFLVLSISAVMLSFHSDVVSGFLGPSAARKPLFHAKRSLSSAALKDTTMADAFESYDINDPSQELAFRDEKVGDGPVVEDGKVVSVAYTGRLMSTGEQFDTGTGYAFRMGDGNVVPGWEKGLKVRIRGSAS